MNIARLAGLVLSLALIVVITLFVAKKGIEQHRTAVCATQVAYIKAVNHCLDMKGCDVTPAIISKYGYAQSYIREYCGRPR